MPTDGGYDSDLYCGHEQDNFSSSPLEYDNEVELERTPDIQSATSPKPSPGASPAPNEEYIVKTPSEWEGYNYLQHDQRDFREYAKLQYQQDLGFRLDETLPRPVEAQVKRLAMEATTQPQQPRQGQRRVEERIDKVISRAGQQAKPSRRSSLRQRAIGTSGPRLPSPTSSKTSGEESGKSKLKSIFDTIFDESKAEVTLRLQSPGWDDCQSSARSTSSPRSSTVRDPRAPEADVLLSDQLAIYPVLRMGRCESSTRRNSGQGSNANPDDHDRTKGDQYPPPPTLHPDRADPQRDSQLDDERHPHLGSSPLEQAQLLLAQRQETSSTTPITSSKPSQLLQPTSPRSQPVQRQTRQKLIVSVRHSDTTEAQSICEYADGDSGSASRRPTRSKQILQLGIVSTEAIKMISIKIKEK
ncbi:hypothetical protein CROQUDRAFT_87547 [Cronartium quercuum f. sp. fusiforme G11]|uniref:Uncharacterized protein n=1 Tax=Cronartium quercuum f. sp. fusiforme G11 TaxID=708437 RepID=A0A9P6NRL8_9BASI|nr:hypothetical protein CROQUDRAFT_87547 [Cronartium quercuum f. sp. fusiforme G11]